MVLFPYNNYMKAIAVFCVFSLCDPVAAAATDQPPASDEVLVAKFCQKLLKDPHLAISALELSSDLAIIGPSLSPLITFAGRHPALNEALLECMRTLLVKNIGVRTPESQAAMKRMQTAALERCREEFGLFCQTQAEGEIVGTCLENLGLYYGPINHITAGAAITEKVNEEVRTQERTNRRQVILGASAIVILGALTALAIANRM